MNNEILLNSPILKIKEGVYCRVVGNSNIKLCLDFLPYWRC